MLVSYCLQQMSSLSPSDATHLLQLGFQPNLATGDLQGSATPAPSADSFSEDALATATHAARPLILELCAGAAGLSAALKEVGFDAVAFDHKRIPGAKTTIQVAPRCVGCFAAPVCGTASRAREIASVSGPPPLRSEEEPDGLADLSPSDQLRVQKANALYLTLSWLRPLGV